MKKKLAHLIREGYAIQEDVEKFEKMERVDLLGKLYAGESFERTIAVRMLNKKERGNLENTERFLNVLETERKFYTRMELFEALRTSTKEQAEVIGRYVGELKMGANNGLAEFCPSKERKFLPEDMAVCVLAQMGEKSFPVVARIINEEDTKMGAILDGLIYMYHYKKINHSLEIEKVIFQKISLGNYEEKIRIKLVKVMSFFETSEAMEKLTEIRWRDASTLVQQEAGRSLLAIYGRSKKENEKKMF